MTEQSGPRDLVRYASAADSIGFDFEVSSDHYSPWLTEQGHSPYAWSVLGAVAQATERVELMTYVTCPTMRYHPAVVAQKAATMSLLSEGRFTLGLGSGENLNEHTVGEGWPAVETRQEMLEEAIEVIRELFAGDLVTFRGEHYAVDAARLWDLPDEAVRIAVAVSGDRSVERFAPLADDLIAVEPDGSIVDAWNAVESRRPDRFRRPSHRSGPDLLGPRREGRGRAGPRAVPVVRRRLERQRRPADHGRVRLGEPVRHARRRRRLDPLRSRPRQDRRVRQRLLGRRVHRRRGRPGGRRGTGPLPRRGGRPAAREAPCRRTLTARSTSISPGPPGTTSWLRARTTTDGNTTDGTRS